MPERIPTSVAKKVVFRSYLSSDHVTPATGKTIAITISKNGATSFSNPAAGATNATEMASGFYKFDLGTGDCDTPGPLAWRGAVATVDDAGDCYEVVGAFNAGFTGVPAVIAGSAGGIPVVGTGANNFKSDASADVTFANTSIATAAAVTTVNGLAAGVITAASIAADAITAAKLHADVTTELQSGLATASALATAQTSIDDILTDTAEIGAAGAGLTNINLPNQTMDIVGNITGNLSGSVGSVSGSVGGNVTGSVGSVVGLTAANLEALTSKLLSMIENGIGSPTYQRFNAAALETAVGTAPSAAAIRAEIDTNSTQLAAILLDTAEIGAAGAGLTNINLPNQSMDIVGNITGNLSGSVGSVTGNVGGSVASVVGLTAVNVDTLTTKLLAMIETGVGSPTYNRFNAAALETAGAGSAPTAAAIRAEIDSNSTQLAAILADTAEIGTAGAGLTNINLPNQTMDIVGNITGNLSGSVGSVTGLTPATVHSDLDDIQARLPAALVGGRLPVDLQSVDASTAAVARMKRALETEVLVTCDTGSSTTAIIASSVSPASVVNDQFNGRVILFDLNTTTPALRGQGTLITDYVHATLTFTVVALTTAPVAGDSFVVV